MGKMKELDIERIEFEVKIAFLEQKIKCYQMQEKEYLDFIEGQEEKIHGLERANAKLKDELEEILKSKNELRTLHYKTLEKKDKIIAMLKNQEEDGE